MILLQLQEITSIDAQIVELHEKLQTLYEQRANLCASDSGTSAANSTQKNSLQSIGDLVNFDDIDLSL